MTHLEKSVSPFLLLHKDNPVDWRPWSDAALAEAKAAGKPILLSIGYTGCHWCHVMNQQCFNDPEIGALINDNFIPILVDREERPDIDQIYQTAANIMGHPGGWPLTMFLMPDGLPYFAGGFLGREVVRDGQAMVLGARGERLDQPSFQRVLTDMIEVYKVRLDGATATSVTVLDELKKTFERETQGGLDAIQLEMASIRVGQRYDIFMGGVVGTNKFPTVPLLEVLWRGYLRSGVNQFLQLISPTMNNILMGGLYDHVGGGFFRYTNDERWLYPHFEKSLNSNAQLVNFMTQMWQFNRNALCRERVSETIDWLLREMRLEGAFASGMTDTAEEEGKYYTWTEAEIDAALQGTFAPRFKQIYGVRKDGDYFGKTILRRLADTAPPTEADEALMTKQRTMLRAVRDKRPKPVRDDKLLADANGLAIHALAFAGSAFDRKDWIAAAITAFEAIVKLMDDNGTLRHVWANGHTSAQGFADDYAHMAEAALQLYESTNEKRYIQLAQGWVKTLDTNFWDETNGGYYSTAHDAEKLVVRTRVINDQPAPAANGAMIALLAKLTLLTGDTSYGIRAQQIAQAFAGEFSRNWAMSGGFLNGFECLATGLQIVVVGKQDKAGTRELIRAVWGKALPDRLLVTVDSTDELPTNHPAYGKPMANGLPTAYICQRATCAQPITSAVVLSQALTLPPQQQRVVGAA